MTEAVSGSRASRDFRAKFPDDVLQDSLAGQLWFGAEVCTVFRLKINPVIPQSLLKIHSCFLAFVTTCVYKPVSLEEHSFPLEIRGTCIL